MNIKRGFLIISGNDIRIKLTFKRPRGVNGAGMVLRIEKLTEMFSTPRLGPDELIFIPQFRIEDPLGQFRATHLLRFLVRQFRTPNGARLFETAAAVA